MTITTVAENVFTLDHQGHVYTLWLNRFTSRWQLRDAGDVLAAFPADLSDTEAAAAAAQWIYANSTVGVEQGVLL